MTLVLLGTACGGAAPAKKTAQAPPPPAVEPGISDRDWGPVQSQSAAIGFLVPERIAWTISEQRGWIEARHAGSDLWIHGRSWRAGGVMNRDKCAIDARSRKRELPHLHENDAFATEETGAPAGYDTQTAYGVRALPDGSVEGVLSVVGGRTRWCVALVAVTRARGRDAERVVVRRLALLAAGTARTIRTRGVEDRVRPLLSAP